MSVVDLADDLLCLGLRGGDRRGGRGGGLGGHEKSCNEQEQHVRRQAPPRSEPRLRDLRGSAHRVGPARHEGRTLAICSDTSNPEPPEKLPKTTVSLSRRGGNRAPTVVRSRPCSGRSRGRGGCCWARWHASACSQSPRRRRLADAVGRKPAGRRRGARREVPGGSSRPLLPRRATCDGAAAARCTRRRRPAARDRAGIAPPRASARAPRCSSLAGSPRDAAPLHLRPRHHELARRPDGCEVARGRDDPARRLQSRRSGQRGRRDRGPLGPDSDDPAQTPARNP